MPVGVGKACLTLCKRPGARLVLRSPRTNSVPAPRERDHRDAGHAYGLMFGIGAALSGLVLTLEDDS